MKREFLGEKQVKIKIEATKGPLSSGLCSHCAEETPAYVKKFRDTE